MHFTEVQIVRNRESNEPRVPVLVGGVPVTPFESVDALVDSVISADGTVRCVTAVAINAEKVVRVRSDAELKRAIDESGLCYPDGIAVVLTMRKKGVRTARTPGVDIWIKLMMRAAQSGVPVYILGGQSAVNDRVVARLRDEFGANVVGNASGYFDSPEEIINTIAASGAKIVTVGMGSPAQERFIHSCRERHPGAFFMGVGGTYDVFVGAIPRAPRWMQTLGLEWMFRLLRQPSRLLRQRALLIYARDHALGRL